MARTFTSGRTEIGEAATEATLVDVLNAIEGLAADIAIQTTPPAYLHPTVGITLAPAADGLLAGDYVVPVGKKMFFKGCVFSGSGDGEFRIEVNSAVQFKARNAWSQRTVTVPAEHWITAGQTIRIAVTNVTTDLETNTYQGSWWGYLLDA